MREEGTGRKEQPKREFCAPNEEDSEVTDAAICVGRRRQQRMAKVKQAAAAAAASPSSSVSSFDVSSAVSPL